MFKFNLLLSSICISLCVGLLCSSAFSTTLVVEDGQLMGATDVLVDGDYYNVEFVDGRASDLFMVAGEYTFTFTTEDEATAAAQALLYQVFLDVSLGGFDTDPELTNGINTISYGRILTPYSWYQKESPPQDIMIKDRKSVV